MSPLEPDLERRRLIALKRLQVLDTEPEEEYDALVKTASLVCDVPVSLISLVDEYRQWFKAKVGVEIAETSREIAFCAHAIQHDDLLEVPDASLDHRFAQNDLVTGAFGLRFYAGVPLTLSGGERVGTICVIDQQPRSLTERQRLALLELGKVVVKLLERRQREQDELVAELGFRAMSEASPFPVFAANADGHLIYTNSRWLQLFDAQAGDDWMAQIAAEDRQRVIDAWLTKDADGEAPQLNFKLRRPGRPDQRVRALWRPLRTADGELVGRAGVIEDVTVASEAEHRVHSLNARLNVEGERKNRFIATLAHELRNPLAVVKNGIRLLKTPGLAADKSGAVLAMMERQTSAIASMVDGLMDLSSISLGKIELKLTQVDLVAVLTQALEAASPAIEARGHELHVELPQEPILVRGDADRLAQVVGNLLTNAAKYTPEKGRIQASVLRRGRVACIVIEDNGVGLSEEQTHSIFAMFEQSQDDASMRANGLGIGLALAQRLATLHGGEVSVRSAGRGQGSTFTLTLPTTL